MRLERNRLHTQSIGRFLAKALNRRWKSYCKRLEEARCEPSTESVHELRVAIRRLSSQFVLLNQVLPGHRARKPRDILKRQLQCLGPLRDTQVQHLFVEQQITRFPELSDLLDQSA